MTTPAKFIPFLAATALAALLFVPASAQEAIPGAPPDEVDQLAQMVDLTEEQQRDIRGVIAEITPRIEQLQTRAQSVQQELEELAGPDFNESEIRETASRLGDMAGEMTALTVILQSRVAQIMTEEQREELEERARQQEQMQQQMMQQQFQQQIEEQLRQQQEEGQPRGEQQAPQQP